jgi:hypothetical protein
VELPAAPNHSWCPDRRNKPRYAKNSVTVHHGDPFYHYSQTTFLHIIDWFLEVIQQLQWIPCGLWVLRLQLLLFLPSMLLQLVKMLLQ